MSSFIPCDNGTFINLNYVKKITPVVSRKGLRSMDSAGTIVGWKLMTEDGTEYTAEGCWIRAGTIGSTILPASDRARALVVRHEEGEILAADRIRAEWTPVLAWRVPTAFPGAPEPVLAQPVGPADQVFVEQPDGRLSHADGRSFANEAELRTAVLAEILLGWEEDQVQRTVEPHRPPELRL
ncbi:MAG TPA: hypothetical protein VD970_03590, partial [Acetobacteraceae bacterium]|nr:hypothetical protein [Acetobacteraceae bacterium]